jgi:urease accessory protein
LNLELLHLCDSLFPIGAFAYSDGLEAAAAVTVRLRPDTTSDTTSASASGDVLSDWINVVLDESIGRLEGPAVWQAWLAVVDGDWRAVATLDEELTAIRPSSAARSASRAMGHRLLTTWRALHPDDRLAHVPPSSALPIAFAAACACGGVDRRESVEAYAYTRLAATASAAMRLLPIGQTDAHRLLAAALRDVPRVVDRIVAGGGRMESFCPALDIATMTQQYLHSRLFRS